MDTMAEHGPSWGEMPEVKLLHPVDVPANTFVIRRILESQPRSYEPFATVDELVDAITRGTLQFWYYRRVFPFAEGAAVTSIQEYRTGVRTFKIEFWLCKNFWAASRALNEAIENKAAELGFRFVEASAHETIAYAAVLKLGYEIAGIQIRKEIQPRRVN